MNNSNEMANGTQDSPLECSPEEQSSVGQWIKTIVYLIILFLALFGNAMVIWIIYKHRRMQTATNYLIVNMAVSSMKRRICMSHCINITQKNIILLQESNIVKRKQDFPSELHILRELLFTSPILSFVANQHKFTEN